MKVSFFCTRICLRQYKGPSIKYATLFLANFDPASPCHTVTHPRPPESRPTSQLNSRTPPFLVGLVQKSRTKAACINSIAEVFARGFLSGRFVWVGFCPFPLLSQYICCNRKLNIT